MHDEPIDHSARHERVRDGVDVGFRDVAVRDVRGLVDDQSPISQRSRHPLAHARRSSLARRAQAARPSALLQQILRSLFARTTAFGLPSSRRFVQTKR